MALMPRESIDCPSWRQGPRNKLRRTARTAAWKKGSSTRRRGFGSTPEDRTEIASSAVATVGLNSETITRSPQGDGRQTSMTGVPIIAASMPVVDPLCKANAACRNQGMRSVPGATVTLPPYRCNQWPPFSCGCGLITIRRRSLTRCQSIRAIASASAEYSKLSRSDMSLSLAGPVGVVSPLAQTSIADSTLPQLLCVIAKLVLISR